MNELALFAGAGGGILGGHLLGWRTVCAVEWEPYPASVLVARQNEGTLPAFPIWDDVQTFDGRPWRGRVDVISGGFPCQDISCAGKGAGIDGERSGMWGHMARIISEVRPRFVFVENSPMLVGRGLARVLGDLAEMGYDARWGVLGAVDAGAPHKRDRIWLVAKPSGSGTWNLDQEAGNENRRTSGEQLPTLRQGNGAHGTDRIDAASESSGEMANSISERGCSGDTKRKDAKDAGQLRGGERQDQRGMGYWHTEPNVGRVANGVANRVDRLKAIGNGQVPQVAALAWRLLRQ
jgi:DNA (cytosine-5)-methyltransferase 1